MKFLFTELRSKQELYVGASGTNTCSWLTCHSCLICLGKWAYMCILQAFTTEDFPKRQDLEHSVSWVLSYTVWMCVLPHDCPSQNAGVMVYQMPFPCWSRHTKLQAWLPRQLAIITHLCETLRFTVSNRSLKSWKEIRIANNIPLSTKAFYRHAWLKP